ncbi:hypothetical protein TSMEX_007993 [Taenia solium]|eukprot:TsM_000221500 transcript=TsM_000221500 gene=TsM_000221500
MSTPYESELMCNFLLFLAVGTSLCQTLSSLPLFFPRQAEYSFPPQTKFAPSPYHLRLNRKEEKIPSTYPPAFQLVIFSAFPSLFAAACEMPIHYVRKQRMHYKCTNSA